MSEIANNKLMVSVYKNFATKLEDRNLVEIFQEIKSEKYQSKINSIRYAIHANSSDIDHPIPI